MTMTVQAYLEPATPAPANADRQIYLHPGNLVFSVEPVLVSTILGSCVSVCLYDQQSGFSGVNHYLLPERQSRAASPRFGDSANEELLAHFLRHRIPASRLAAKVFGGASMGGSRAGDLATRNVEAALSFLSRHAIPITARDTGGERGRKLVFRSSDSAAFVRLL